MKLIATNAHSTWTSGLKRLQHWALYGVLALACLLGAGQALAAAPFVDNGNGTVTDTSTGLMWDQCAAGLSGNGSCTTGALEPYNWANAFGWAATQSAANYKGYSDWRLPSLLELRSLVKGTASPTIDTAAFPGTFGWAFWSASSYEPFPNGAWFVRFSDGGSGARGKASTDHVRLVRINQSFDTFALSVDAHGGGAGTVTASGLACARASQVTSGTCARQVANTAYAGSTAQSLTLTATPAIGSVFTGWGGVCSGSASTCTVTINAATRVSAEFTAISTSSIVIDPATPSTLYAALDGGGVYASTDSSAPWSAINTGLANLNVRALAMPSSSTLFAATYDGGVFKGSLSGSPAAWSWAACGTGLPGSARLRSLIVDSAGNLYAGSETGVFKNTSACGAWTAQNTGMP